MKFISSAFFGVTLFLLSFLSDKAFAQVQPITTQQIQLLLQEKGSRSPSQRKIDSRLLQAVRESNGKSMVTGVNLAPVKVNADTKGNLKVDIRATVSDELISKIQSLGGKILNTSWKYSAIRAQVNLSMIETIAGYAEVKFIKPATLSMTVGTGKPVNSENKNIFCFASILSLLPKQLFFAAREESIRNQLNKITEATSNYVTRPLTGSVTSEGDRAHRADDVRNTYGYAGGGIRIGVLSDSYDATGGAEADVLNGDLPGIGNPLGDTTPVTVVADFPDGEDEGRAMLQIVHDVAPKAQLFFATADVSEAGFASNIETLRNPPYNCDIIIDDVFYFDEPVFQDGIIAQAVNTVTAGGGLYFSSSGNSGSVAKNTAGYFEGDFNDTGSVVFTFPDESKAGTIHNFGTAASPLNGDIINSTGEAYTLTWADPQGASNNDYDLFVVGSDGSVKSSSTNIQDGSEDPYEEIFPDGLVFGDRLVVFKSAGAQKKAFAINTSRGTLQLVTTGQTSGHSAAVDAFSVAATPASSPYGNVTVNGPFPNAFTSSNQVETFSSDGPRRVFFNGDGTAITPGNFLFGTNGGSVRNKPDLTAADGVSTTLPAGSGLNPFYGTSAAAPHAGAIAALLKSADPSLSTTQVRNILTSTALDIESPGYDINSGYGIVQAFQAMQALNPTPVSNIDLGTVTFTEGSFSNGNGIIESGEIANLVVQLKNPSLIEATAVQATLTTSTPGVTITQNFSSYDSIASLANAFNTKTPFQFGLNPTVGCGTVINFVLTVSFVGGPSPKTFSFTLTTGAGPISISSALGQEPPTGAGYTSVEGVQTGRISRNGISSSCTSPKDKNDLFLFSTTGDRQYDAYTVMNSSSISQCVTVTLTSSSGDSIYTAAYDSSGFVSADPLTGYLADPGFSETSQQYSFEAPAKEPFTVVVHAIAVQPTPLYPYQLDVAISSCDTGPACTPVIITTDSIAAGTTNLPYNQSFAASGGSGAYTFSLSGTLPNGLSFSGDTLTGTPTQAGIFPIILKATDAAGCPVGIQNDTLKITLPVTYIFNGNGNWSDASNWNNDQTPPATLLPGSQIIINPSTGGQCILDIPYTLSPQTTLTVMAAQSFIIQGNLIQQN